MATVNGGQNDPNPGHPRAWALIERKPLTVGRAAWIISLATLVVTMASGVAIRFGDRTDFHSIGTGLWWSIQTVTTVGYGDIVPTNTVGRLIATLVMLTGIAFLTVITATITSRFVEVARQRAEGARADAVAVQLHEISARLDAIETSVRNIAGPGDGTR